MKYKLVIFDFDGTICDTGEGILKSAKFALDYYNIEAPNYTELTYFIGPPLLVTFQENRIDDRASKMLYQNKIKKKDGDMSIALKRTKDIIGTLGEHKKEGQFICGFSMETENVIANSKDKLIKKNMDMIVANNVKVAGAGFGTDTNVVTIITGEDNIELPMMSKEDVASKILDFIMAKRR